MTTTYGPTPQGFILKPYDVIVKSFEDGERATMDPAMQTGSATPLGQLNGIVAGGVAECWEVLQTLANGLNRDAAEGAAQDNVGDITGDQRLPPEPSSVTCDCTLAAANAPYAAGALVCNVLGDSTRQFSNVFDVPADVVVADGVYPVLFASVKNGPIEAVEGSLTVITAPVSGWSAVTNPSDAIPGQLLETDAQYIERQREELAAAGACTVDAIRADLLNIGLVSAKVQENVTDYIDPATGIPPHSMRAIVWDGTPDGSAINNDDIALTIWKGKPTGVRTFGDFSWAVTDAAGEQQIVFFSRAGELPVYMSVSVTLAPGALLATVAPAVKSMIVNLSRGFKADGVTPTDPETPGRLEPGDSVIALIYRAAALGVAGVKDVPALALDFTASPTATANLTVPAEDVAALDTSRILVNGV